MDPDLAFDNVSFVPGGESYPARWSAAAAFFRDARAAQDAGRTRLAYGSHARQICDLFLPDGAPRGVFVFVHGGFWRRFSASDWSHLAAGAVGQGWSACLPSYILAPRARISEITGQIARAITAASDRIAGPIVLAGHSAGGQAVARMAERDGPLPEPVARRLTHVAPISPLGDLRPLLATAMNADLRLDPAEAAAESPVLRVPRPGLPVSIWVGENERPAFLDQARDLAAAWQAPLHVVESRHHFDVIDALADPVSEMIGTVLRA